MLKSATAYVLVVSILTVSLTSAGLAQKAEVLSGEPAKSGSATTRNLKEAIDMQTARLRAETAVFDPVKVERENANQQARKKGWSKSKTTWVIVAVVAGLAVATFLAIKYGKKCLRYSTTDCSYDPDTGSEECRCEEYEQKDK